MTTVSIDASLPTTEQSGNGSKPTLHQTLRDALTRRETAQPVTLEVPSLATSKVGVTFLPAFSIDQLEAWQRWAEDGEGKTNPLTLACTILAECCRGIVVGGEAWVEDGQPVTFATKAVLDSLGVMDGPAAVKALYGNDFHVTATSDLLLEKAGFGTKIGTLDPSRP